MNLGKRLRSGYAVDLYATASTPEATAVTPVVMAATVAEPTTVERIVYVDKVVEKPVYIDRVVEVEKIVEVKKIVEVAAVAETESTFFDDYVPTDWTTQKANANV